MPYLSFRLRDRLRNVFLLCCNFSTCSWSFSRNLASFSFWSSFQQRWLIAFSWSIVKITSKNKTSFNTRKANESQIRLKTQQWTFVTSKPLNLKYETSRRLFNESNLTLYSFNLIIPAINTIYTDWGTKRLVANSTFGRFLHRSFAEADQNSPNS
jgi:hypothetical protein